MTQNRERAIAARAVLYPDGVAQGVAEPTIHVRKRRPRRTARDGDRIVDARRRDVMGDALASLGLSDDEASALAGVAESGDADAILGVLAALAKG